MTQMKTAMRITVLVGVLAALVVLLKLAENTHGLFPYGSG